MPEAATTTQPWVIAWWSASRSTRLGASPANERFMARAPAATACAIAAATAKEPAEPERPGAILMGTTRQPALPAPSPPHTPATPSESKCGPSFVRAAKTPATGVPWPNESVTAPAGSTPVTFAARTRRGEPSGIAPPRSGCAGSMPVSATASSRPFAPAPRDQASSAPMSAPATPPAGPSGPGLRRPHWRPSRSSGSSGRSGSTAKSAASRGRLGSAHSTAGSARRESSAAAAAPASGASNSQTRDGSATPAATGGAARVAHGSQAEAEEPRGGERGVAGREGDHHLARRTGAAGGGRDEDEGEEDEGGG